MKLPTSSLIYAAGFTSLFTIGKCYYDHINNEKPVEAPPIEESVKTKERIVLGGYVSVKPPVQPVLVEVQKPVKPVLVKPKVRHFSARLISGIKHFENEPLANKPDDYVDHARFDKLGKVTEIGYGFTHNMVDAGIRFKVLTKGYTLPKSMTKAEADAFLVDKALPICDKLVNHYTTAELTLHQREALIMFVYNLGEGALKQLKVHNDVSTVPNRMLRYCHCKGRTIKGLVRRRKFEVAFFKSNI